MNSLVKWATAKVDDWWPREEKINNHGCWGKHAHIPDKDYWGICWFHVVWTNFFSDFKSKSQNIWQQIILFSSTVMQLICMWHKIWTLSGRLSEFYIDSIEKIWQKSLVWINFHWPWATAKVDDWWPREEKINNHGCWGKHAHIPDKDYWGICWFHVVSLNMSLNFNSNQLHNIKNPLKSWF
jgi:hypothetical protein